MACIIIYMVFHINLMKMVENYIQIFKNATLNKVVEDLQLNLFYKNIGSKNLITVEYSDLRKSIWLASILAKSALLEHKQKVQKLSSLIFLNNPENSQLAKICYILYSRVGNLTATRFLSTLYKNYSSNPLEQLSIFSEDLVLESELLNKRRDNILEIEGSSYLATDFQMALWNNLIAENYISVSAPTSSGKSFILKKYIEHQFHINEKYCVFYIVPSRALINQVSEELRIDLGDVEIKTAYIEDDESLFSKIVYVITPERAIKIINLDLGIPNPDIIFIDEIQGVEDEQGRGDLFEYIYGEFARLFPSAKLITAGPNISNPDALFSELFSHSSKVASTSLSPVFQLKAIIQLNEDSIQFRLYDDRIIQTIKKPLTTDKNLKRIYSNNRGDGLAIIINEVILNGKESNIIYASRSDHAETWALKYSESIPEEELPIEILDLIEYLQEDIHKKYILIKCLKKRVAFHHGKLSELARKEIEVLFQRGIIKTLFCTSTLLEGVNMPANNLFIVKPDKNNLSLTNFEFGNLIGRAGRIKDSLYGSIYCITLDDENWASEYYERTHSKEVVTSSTKGLKELKVDNLASSTLDIDEGKIKNLVISLRHKYLKGDLNLESFLTKKGLLKDQIFEIEAEIAKSVSRLQIPYEIIKLNPTIDPVLQNELFIRIKNDGLKQWAININSRFADGYRRDTAVTLSYEQNSFYWQLDSIIHRLNEIFGITNELFYKDKLKIYESTICHNSIGWIDGKSIGELIGKRIDYLAKDERVPIEERIDPDDEKAINAAIRYIININSKAITYSLLKYVKLLVNILEFMFTDDEKEQFKFTLSLPTYLELGSKEPVVIRLITSGMPRSIALKVFDKFKTTQEYREKVDVINWLKGKDYIDGLKPIYNKYLRRQKYLSR